MNVEAPFRIDPANRCLWRAEPTGERRIELPPKTFDVLRYLAENAGRTVPHAELLDALWGTIPVQPEVLKTHVLAARNALGDKAEAPHYIETVRGRGYRFIGALDFGGPAVTQENEQASRGIFVGREEALKALADVLERAVSGRPQVAFVAGEPGIGKTALIDRFIAKASGIVHSHGRCVEGFGGTEPYYPVLEALGELCKGPIGAHIRQALAETAPTWAVQMPAHVPASSRAALQKQIVGTAPERMLREICELLEQLAAERPIILVFEDLHWADYSTVDFLSALARRRSSAKLLVIATYRHADAGAAHHPLRQVVQDLLLHKLCTEILLPPLGEAAVARFLAGDGSQASTAEEFVALILSQSGGNPLFMQALLDHLVERGLVARAERGWTLQATAEAIGFEVPPTLGQLIEARIRGIAERERQVLEAASIVGLEFFAAAAAGAIGLNEADFEEVCDGLVRRECFVHRLGPAPDRHGPQRYSFNHSVYRQVFYRRQSETRRRQLHQNIGERLEQRAANSERGIDLAQHFIAAHDWPRALHYLRIDLDAAKRRVAYRDALAVLDQIMAVAACFPESRRRTIEINALEQRALVYGALYDPRLYETYEQLLSQVATHDDVDIRVRILVNAGEALSWISRSRCLPVLDQALQLSAAQIDPSLRASTRVAAHARRLLVAGWSDHDAQQCEEGVAALRGGENPAATARAMIDYGLVCMVSTRYKEAIAAVRPNFQFLYDQPHDQTQPGLARAVWMNLVGVPTCLLMQGDFGAALDAFDSSYVVCAQNGNRAAAAACRIYRAALLFHAMDFAGALEACEQVLSPQAVGETAVAGIRPVEKRLALLFAGLAETGLGRNAAARRHLTEVRTMMEHQTVMLDWYWQVMLERGWVDLALQTGDARAAARHAERLIGVAEATIERTWQGLAWEASARVAHHRGNAAEAAASVEKALAKTQGFDTPLADWRIHETAAAIHGDLRNRERAMEHGRRAADERTRLAGSLPRGHRLRAAFENPSQRRVFGAEPIPG